MPAAERRRALYGLLGDLPARDGELSWQSDFVRQEDGVLIEHVTLFCNGREPVPCWFTKPAAAEGKLPVMLYAHSHGGFYGTGKDELLNGQVYMQRPGYAKALAERGIAALCPDAWCFGERKHNTEGELFREMLMKGQTLWGGMVYDHLRALDYLCTREDVDPDRIGVMGMSMGSTQAWWLAALDTRLKVCVDICCLTEYQAAIDRKALCEHGVYYFVPGILKHFGTADINALIAPRAHFGLAGTRDALTPPEGLDRIDEVLKRVYAEQKAPENWTLKRYDTPHFETPEMRRDVLAYIEAKL